MQKDYPKKIEISYQEPLEVFSILEDIPMVFLESALSMPACGRYSFIALDPFEVFSQNSQNPFYFLKKICERYPLQNYKNLPPFQGGIAGFFSYDLASQFEKIPRPNIDDMHFPDFCVGLFDLVIAFDQQEKRAWIFSSGYPFKDSETREKHSEKRLTWLLEKLKIKKNISENEKKSSLTINSNFTAAAYQQAVQKVKNYILSGDIFQANLSQRFHANLSAEFSTAALYRKTRRLNPAPFAAYVNLNNVTLVSASPERFVKLEDGSVETRPIKGTRPRGKTYIQDESLANALLNSEKDRAENIMIVDLLRNDLSRVCLDHSVNVSQLCGLERYETVHHLVSVIHGKLKKDFNAFDLLQATFPGGSITGAPKIRAQEIIAEIEPTCRGPYCGALGYIGFNGNMDTSIIIRTFAIKNQQLTFQAGGAVVLDSDPEAEYVETLLKAKALHKALYE